jgi:hypothetical protein
MEKLTQCGDETATDLAVLSPSDIPPRLDDGAWFHGSNLDLDVLAPGSSITRSRIVAEAFSHQPTCLGLGDEDRPISICHNGTERGILYVIDEPVRDCDVHAHPHSAAPILGFEWITNRPLRLRKLADLPIADPPCNPNCPRKPSA